MTKSASDACVNIAGAAVVDDCHVCALFDDDADERAVIDPVVTETIAARKRLLVIIDPNEHDSELRRLEDAGLDADRLIASGQVLILDWTDAYVRYGRFDHEAVLGLLRDSLREGRRLGFAGTRAIGHMEWVLSSPPGVEALYEYESRATALLAEEKSSGICIYRSDRFESRGLVDAILAHPHYVAGRTLRQNPFFPFRVPTESLLPGREGYEDLTEGLT